MDPNRVWRGSVTEAGCSNPSQNDNSQDPNETKINREVEIYVVVAGGGGEGGGWLFLLLLLLLLLGTRAETTGPVKTAF